jgi:hypothetical protein
MAGLGGLEPANVVLKRPLKSWANSYWTTEHFGTRDFSRASCQVTDLASGNTLEGFNVDSTAGGGAGISAFADQATNMRTLGALPTLY